VNYPLSVYLQLLRTLKTKGRHYVTLFGRQKESRFARIFHLFETICIEQELRVAVGSKANVVWRGLS
jgi:hypothetical protein